MITMCGRYTLFTLADFLKMFPWILPPEVPPPPRYNIAPTQPILAVANHPQRKLEYYHWGLIPSWAKDPSIGQRMINARAETLAEKPAFKAALRRRRCLIPADGFFEWRKNADGSKTPLYIQLKNQQAFAFAGLWEQWHASDGSVVPSCTVVTTEPNDLLRPVHNRMPCILPPNEYERWLKDGEMNELEGKDLLRPYPSEAMQVMPVSPRVNSAAHDDPGCIESMTAAAGPPEPSKKKDDQSTLF